MGKLTNLFKISLIDDLFTAISSNSDYYYVFGGYPSPWIEDSNPPAVFNGISDTIFTSDQTMLMGKRVFSENVQMLVPQYTWTSNTVYAQYSQFDDNLLTKPFFVLTDENKVFKCLYNNKGLPSTVKPTLAQNTAFTTVADNYVWKYMYSVSVQLMSEFAANGYFPVLANSSIVSSAKSGIDVIEIMSGGQNWLTYVTGTLQGVANSTVLQIDNFASQDNNFYNKSAFYVTGGPGIGTLSLIDRYVSNSTGNFVILDQPVSSLIPFLTQYQIAPNCLITGDGNGAKAILTVGNNFAISNVSVLSTGNGYTRATVTVMANSSYGTSANLIAYVAPPGGHGSNPIKELGTNVFGINVEFEGNESTTLDTNYSFRRYGLLKNPMQSANVLANYTSNTFNQLLKVTTNPATTFQTNETIVGATSDAIGTVVFSNSSILMMVGDKTFANAELITGQTTNLVTEINSIITIGSISQYSGDILYLTNMVPVERSNTSSETINLTIKI